MNRDPHSPTPAIPGQPQPSRIILEFPTLGAADPSVHLVNVTVGQVYAGAWLLDAIASEQRVAQRVNAGEGPEASDPLTTMPEVLRKLGLSHA